MNVIQLEQPDGVIATLGGQTAINLAQSLTDRGVKITAQMVPAEEAVDFAALVRES